MATTEATVYTYADWQSESVGETSAFLNAMHSGKRFECDREMYYYWLEILPPAWMHRTVTLDGVPVRTRFGFAEGYEPVTAFWTEDKRYFGQRTTIMNPHA